MESRTGIVGGEDTVRVKNYQYRRIESGFFNASRPCWKIIFEKIASGYRMKLPIIPTGS
jgi:hypothetical protein